MAHSELYASWSSYDPLAPWPDSNQADIRDLRDPLDMGTRILRVRSQMSRTVKTHELADLMEAGRS